MKTDPRYRKTNLIARQLWRENRKTTAWLAPAPLCTENQKNEEKIRQYKVQPYGKVLPAIRKVNRVRFWIEIATGKGCLGRFPCQKITIKKLAGLNWRIKLKNKRILGFANYWFFFLFFYYSKTLISKTIFYKAFSFRLVTVVENTVLRASNVIL